MWDIINKSIYQHEFQSFCVWRTTEKAVSDEELGMLADVSQVRLPLLHRNLAHILTNCGKTVEDQNIDWATAEALAFGTPALERNHIRLSGQDVECGICSQRHAVIHD